jgi:acetyl-CoA carboxylase biotin carboxyl carrier protein
MQIDDVRQLVKLVEESGIEELEISSEGTTIRIQKRRSGEAALSAPPQQFVYPAPLVPDAPAPAALSGVAEERARWKEFRSPIVGTFYRAAAPGAESFVSVGDRIAVGQTVCIIEAMKVMNEIEAETAGIIREILVENASPVEAEAILFLIEPQ